MPPHDASLTVCTVATPHRGYSRQDWYPRVGLFCPFIVTVVARLGERLTGTDNFVQDEVPVTNPPKQALAEKFVNVSRLAAILFLFERLFRLLVGKCPGIGEWSAFQWDLEPQRGWVTSPLGNFTIELRRYVPCLKTLRHDVPFSPFSLESFNSCWMVRICSFLRLFFVCRRAAAYNGPHTLLRRTSLKRGNKALPLFFSPLLGFVWGGRQGCAGVRILDYIRVGAYRLQGECSLLCSDHPEEAVQ